MGTLAPAAASATTAPASTPPRPANCSSTSSGCTQPASSPAPASASRACARSWNATAAASAPPARSARALPSPSPSPLRIQHHKKQTLHTPDRSPLRPHGYGPVDAENLCHLAGCPADLIRPGRAAIRFSAEAARASYLPAVGEHPGPGRQCNLPCIISDAEHILLLVSRCQDGYRNPGAAVCPGSWRAPVSHGARRP